ncbi:hypothetical protein TOPB45_1306 [Thermodesulfobacterium geofontis OPF15]|jgi:hypothetical protein|uniref:VCBS repeat-containing protein n=1 Tax=Thermodesulfobacterium geofontis (strain OPF15) TaxID=795359 RepID=F8C4T4_THEGP|nr:hypothetical protein [Thermodesulfobacterium geofontis]AEH23387.1 hypothetical protein TOPB45_1306 [Thermodesulfobacterium geofontis OPF15]
MKIKKFLIFLGWGLVFLLLSPNFSFSLISPETYEEIKKDFTPLSALIIGIEDNKIIIDKGKVQGVRPKDIFTVYKRGKKIVHPETEKTLGFLKEIIGKIEITDVEENFAIGRVIFQKEPFPVPTPIERFTDLKILIISETQTPDENLFLILKNTLPESAVTFNPNLKLKDLTPQYLLSQQYDIVFVVEEDIVKIFNYNLDLIRYYGTLSYKKTIAPSTVTTTQKAYKPSTGVFSINPPTILGKMKGEVFQVEFADIDNDGSPEMIYFNSQGLFIVRIKGALLASYTPKTGKIVNFSLGPSGWIALNIFDESVGMRSEILRYTEQGLTPVITNVNLILNFVDYTARGVKDTLIGQTFDSENFFGKEVYILKRENNQLIYATQLKVPPDYKNIGSAFVDLDGDGSPEIINYTSDGKLAVYKDSNIVWISPYPVANHFYEIKLIKGKKGQEVVKKIVYPLITPVIADINKDGKLEVLFVSANFPLETVKGDLKYVPLNSATSQIFVLGFEGTYFFRNLWASQTGFITGLGVFENGIYYTLVKGNYPGNVESELYFSIF